MNMGQGAGAGAGAGGARARERESAPPKRGRERERVEGDPPPPRGRTSPRHIAPGRSHDWPKDGDVIVVVAVVVVLVVVVKSATDAGSGRGGPSWALKRRGGGGGVGWEMKRCSCLFMCAGESSLLLVGTTLVRGAPSLHDAEEGCQKKDFLMRRFARPPSRCSRLTSDARPPSPLLKQTSSPSHHTAHPRPLPNH
jgi:hypothetical protein